MLFVALCCFFVLANGVIRAGQAEDRTNCNDNQTLLGIVVQLQAKVLSMDNEAEKMKGKLQKVKVQQEQTQADVATLQASPHKQAAFSVFFAGQGRLNIGTRGIIRFDKIVTNIAGGYNLGTGIFTAPYAGVYAFFCTIRSVSDQDWVTVGIVKGNTPLVYATALGKADHWDKGSAFATVHLQKADQVFVRQDSGDTYVERGIFTTFSGILVTAD